MPRSRDVSVGKSGGTFIDAAGHTISWIKDIRFGISNPDHGNRLVAKTPIRWPHTIAFNDGSGGGAVGLTLAVSSLSVRGGSVQGGRGGNRRCPGQRCRCQSEHHDCQWSAGRRPAIVPVRSSGRSCVRPAVRRPAPGGGCCGPSLIWRARYRRTQVCEVFIPICEDHSAFTLTGGRRHAPL